METIIETMWKPIFNQKLHIPPSRNSFSGLWKTVFSICQIMTAKTVSVETYFQMNSSFWRAKTVFLSCRNIILIILLLFFYSDFRYCGNSFLLFNKTATEISGDTFFRGNALFPLIGRVFLFSGNCFLLFRASFLEVETVTKTSWNN